LVMPSAYVPEAGDIVWLEFDPLAGHEQAGGDRRWRSAWPVIMRAPA